MAVGIGLEDPAIEAGLRSTTDVARREALLDGIQLAISDVGLVDTRIDRILATTGRGSLQPEVRDEILAFAAELDEIAWQAQDSAETDPLASEAYSVAFRRARAVSALGYVFETDSLVAALEGLYEAYHAMKDPQRLRERLIERFEGPTAEGKQRD